MPRKYSQNHDSYIQKYNETNTATILDIGRQVEGKRKDQSTFHLNLKVNKITYQDEPYYMGVIHSIQNQLDNDQKIRNQAQLLERAEEIAHLGHWHVDLEENNVFWSKEIYRIHGVTPETYAPELESAIHFYHPEDIDSVRKNLDHAVQNRTDFTFEARIVQPSGNIRHVRSSGETQVDTSGAVSSIFGIFQDITEEKLTLQKIQEANAFQSLIMGNIPDFLFVKDKEFKIVQANEAFLNLYPKEMRDKVIGYTTIENYAKEEAEEFLKEDKKAFDQGLSEVEETIQFPDGQQRTLLTKKVRFQKESGDEFILGLARDITELKDTQKSLIEMEHTTKAYADATNDGYWDWFIQDDYEYMSPRFWDMLGFDPSEKEHHPKEWQALIFEDDLHTALENFEKHIETKGEHPFAQEARYRHKNGSTVHVICKGKVVQWDKDDRPIRMIGTHTDITKLKETEDALLQSNSELEEFSYRISHDLRSPLVSSIGLISLAKGAINQKDYGTTLKSLEHTENSLTKLESLVQDILLLAQTQKEEEHEKTVVLESIVDSAISKLSNMENFDRLQLKKSLNYTDTLFLKENRLVLILENMISNAIKYQDLKETQPYIKISSDIKDNQFILTVTDNGLGIPEKQHDKIFQMFKRFHSNVSFGSGLGLYMMKKSAQILGGDITFEPQKKGTLFKLSIPLEKISTYEK